jgi:hypothetical protein
VVALLASEALQVVYVVPGPHHHLESRYNFRARSAVPSVAKQPVKDVGFEVFTAVAMKNVVFWDVAPRGVIINRSFGGTCRLYL